MPVTHDINQNAPGWIRCPGCRSRRHKSQAPRIDGVRICRFCREQASKPPLKNVTPSPRKWFETTRLSRALTAKQEGRYLPYE